MLACVGVLFALLLLRAVVRKAFGGNNTYDDGDGRSAAGAVVPEDPYNEEQRAPLANHYSGYQPSSMGPAGSAGGSSYGVGVGGGYGREQDIVSVGAEYSSSVGAECEWSRLLCCAAAVCSVPFLYCSISRSVYPSDLLILTDGETYI